MRQSPRPLPLAYACWFFQTQLRWPLFEDTAAGAAAACPCPRGPSRVVLRQRQLLAHWQLLSSNVPSLFFSACWLSPAPAGSSVGCIHPSTGGLIHPRNDPCSVGHKGQWTKASASPATRGTVLRGLGSSHVPSEPEPLFPIEVTTHRCLLCWLLSLPCIDTVSLSLWSPESPPE